MTAKDIRERRAVFVRSLRSELEQKEGPQAFGMV